MRRIDLREVLRQTVADGYGDLVTRRTGRAGRGAIERALAELDHESVALIDFGTVRCLDLSCADEIVGGLLREQGQARYFILLNLDDAQREAIEFVLEGHGLTAVMRDRSGTLGVLGHLPEPARQAFRVLAEAGAAGVDEVARRLDLSLEAARQALEELHQRRLVLSSAGAYSAPAVA
jgi:hypothetical protein